MRVNPESVYLEPTKVWNLSHATGELTAPRGLTIHAKCGARWRSILLMPNADESYGELLHRVGDWLDDSPETWISELFDGFDMAASGDSERVAS